MNWAAAYYDGVTARSRAVTIQVTDSGLLLALDDGTTRWWDASGLRIASRRPVVRLEHGVEAVVLRDASILAALPPTGARTAAYRATGFVLSLMAVLFLLYLKGLPALARAGAAAVPPSWEVALGEAIYKEMVAPESVCTDETGNAEIARLAAHLAAALPESPYEYRVAVIREPSFNAFALPGGALIVHSGLLEKTGSPEQLAGVLAHEMQHVELRHATRAVLRDASFRLLLTAVVTGGAEIPAAAKAVGSLGVLRYRRQDEEEADTAGLRLMEAARLDASAMIEIYRVMEQESFQPPKGFDPLLTHPNLPERIDRLTNLIRPDPVRERYETTAPWSRTARMCRE
ncbi:MAG: M48 family metallopeptidase [Bryobacterales bacterium]|nr:M48 family metallopeptidase [Bryobacterales bacterium]